MGSSPARRLSPAFAARQWSGVAPMEQETLLVRLSMWCMRVVLLALFVYLTRRFFLANGFDISAAATGAAYGSVFLLLLAQIGMISQTRSPFGYLEGRGKTWYLLVVLMFVWCTVEGLVFREYDTTAVANDAAPWLLLMGSIVLGSIPLVWKQLDGVVFWLFVAAVVINLLGLREIERVLTYADSREGIQTLAYKTQWALSFWPYLLLTARQRSWPKMLVIFGGVFFYLIQQIMFQKRAPLGRVLLFVLIFAFVVPRIGRYWRSWRPEKERLVRQAGLVFAGVGLLAMLVVAPGVVTGQMAGLLSRFSGQQYRSGAVGVVAENERFFEAGVMLKSLNTAEVVFGRGFGGYYPITGGMELLTHPGAWLSDVQSFGRRELHVGALMPMLKGGLLLMTVYYTGVFMALFRGRKRLDGPLNTAAFFILAVSTLALLQEGSFIMPHAFDVILMGMCLGRLLAEAPGGEKTAGVPAGGGVRP